jgi:lipopolysaccharide export LptBFGC system permease protein LptF
MPTQAVSKAMTTKLKRIRLQGFFTTVRFHNVMHEWKGTWVGFIAHVIKQIHQYQNLCEFESDKYSDTQLITFMDAIFNQTKGLSQVLIQNKQTHKAAGKDPRISFKEFVEQLTECAKIYNAACKKTRSQTWSQPRHQIFLRCLPP